MTQPRTQQERTRATRTTLITAGRALFAQRGYAAVPAEEIVAAAGLTRGALQHHFGDKKELFRAVFEQGESELPSRGGAAGTGQPDSWAATTAGLRAVLNACQEPGVLQIARNHPP